MNKNKIILIISTFLIFACEDKEDDINPLVGQWNMTDFTSGTYMRLNKTQEILKLAVKRMLPGGPLAKKQLTKLKIYNGDKHPHDIQKPKVIEFDKLNKKNVVR